MAKYLRKTRGEHPGTAYPRAAKPKPAPNAEELEQGSFPELGRWSEGAFPLRASSPDGYRAEVVAVYPRGYTGSAGETAFDWSVRHDNGQIVRGRAGTSQIAKIAAQAGLMELQASRERDR
jgi:hypothetical protein